MNHPKSTFLAFLVALALGSALAGCQEAPPQIGDPCQLTTDCAPERALVCRAGLCFKQRCAASLECEEGLACLDGFCRSPDCLDDDGCEPDALCIADRCVPDGCRDRRDCPEGQVCDQERATCAQPPATCAGDQDCPRATTCWSPRRECRATCQSAADCPAGAYCDEAGTCRPPCGPDEACLDDERCASGRCAPRPDCSGLPACTGSAPFRDPLTCACVRCLSSLGCAQDERCTDARECLYCELPASRHDCAALGLQTQQGCCVECRSSADCAPATPFCTRGRCTETAAVECIADSDCPLASVCDRGRCAPQASYADCTAQSDCPAGEACFGDDRCRAAARGCSGCPSPSRCIHDGSQPRCAGCTQACSADGCPSGQVCAIAPDARDGVCLDQQLAFQCSE